MYKILIAEDEPIERKVLRKLLERNLGEDCTVLEAKNGREAVNLYEQERPQLLLLDIELPGISGLEAARQIRSEGGECAIVFVSAYDNFSYAREAITLRAQDYLLKPYAEQELILTVEEAIRLYAQERPAPPVAREEPHQPEQDVESARLSYVRDHIERYIQENYHTSLSLQKAAQAMNYSDTHFCRLFKQCFKVNFSAYLTAYRVERAKERLSGTMDTVKEVGAACGYSDTSYFIRVFKRVTGLTPSEYRIAAGQDRRKVP